MHPEEAYVLVIEDNANNLMVTTDFLRMMGVKYVNARASGWQALKLAENLSRVDLILLDLQLPYEDGYAVLSRIRSIPKLQDTRVVAVTANVFPQEELRARKAGFNGFIAKPLDIDSFPRLIQKALDGHEVWRVERQQAES